MFKIWLQIYNHLWLHFQKECDKILNGDFMKCENYLCIYEKNGICCFDEVELDIDGRCTSCIYPNFEKEILQHFKEKTLKNLNEP